MVDEKEIIKSLHSRDELGGYGTDVIRDEFGNVKNSKLIEFVVDILKLWKMIE